MIKNENGFTITELVIVMTVTSVLVGVIMLFTFSYWQYSYVTQANQDTFTDRLNASDFLREAIGSSAGLITQPSITDPNVGSADPANPQHWIPVHAIPGTTTYDATSSITPLMYYTGNSINASRQIIYNGTQPYLDEFVLYLDKPTKSLMLRTLANPYATGNKAKTSCPASAATVDCPADRVLSANIDSIGKRFFSRSGGTIDWTSIYDSDISDYAGPDNPSVEVAELTLNISKKAVFQKSNTVSSSTVVRIALRNT